MPSVMPPLSERQFQAQVIELARRFDWMVFHPVTAQKKGVYATFQAGDKGYPDLTLAKAGEGLLFAELKTDTGKLSAEQLRWAFEIQRAGGEWHLWRPSDMDAIVRRLACTAR